MRNIAAYLLGLLVAGCGAGVSSDPTGPGDPMESNPTPLATEPTPLLASVLTTQAITSDAENDATYLAIVEDTDTHGARLVRQDIRNAEITELDRMPIGKGTAQLLLGADGIVWGFGGDGSEPVTFRLVGSSSATAIPFADHGPANLIAQAYDHLLYYASAHDCAIEPLDMTTGQINTGLRTSVSCFMTIESVVQTRSWAYFRASDDPGYSIRGYFKSLNTGLKIVDQSDSALVGPFPSTVEQSGFAVFQDTAWSRTGSDGKSHILTWPTNPPLSPLTELQIIDDAVDAGALVHGEFWGATLGNPTILFHVAEDGVRRHTVDYQPRAIFSLHNRLVILTTDGTLLDQPISADD